MHACVRDHCGLIFLPFLSLSLLHIKSRLSQLTTPTATMDIKYELTVDRDSMNDALRVVLSCILFHRLFGPSIPQTKEGLGVTYPCVENSEVETLIEDKLIQLIKLERTTSSKQIQVGVQFFEKRPKKPSWFGKTSEDVCWEQWVININIDQEISRKRIENQVREILLSIVGVVNTNKEHIPPITTTDATPFPYQIVVPSSDQSNNATTIEGWGSVIKKMLVDAPE